MLFPAASCGVGRQLAERGGPGAARSGVADQRLAWRSACWPPHSSVPVPAPVTVGRWWRTVSTSAASIVDRPSRWRSPSRLLHWPFSVIRHCWRFYAVAVVGGVTTASTPRPRVDVEAVPAEEHQNAVVLNSAMMTLSRVIGPALAGALGTTVARMGFTSMGSLPCLPGVHGVHADQRDTTSGDNGRAKAPRWREGSEFVRSMPRTADPLSMRALVARSRSTSPRSCRFAVRILKAAMPASP